MKRIYLLCILTLRFALAEADSAAALQYSFTTLAGPLGGPGYSDGTGSTARLNNPRGVTVDIAGNVYVADTGNHTIRKVSPDGAVTTLAGKFLMTLDGPMGGSADGIGLAARFNYPTGVALDQEDNAYVADAGNNTIR